MSREEELQRLLVNARRRLQALQERKALYGLDTPVAVLTEIEDLRAEIERFEVELVGLTRRRGAIPVVPAVGSGSAPPAPPGSPWLWIAVGGLLVLVLVLAGWVAYIIFVDNGGRAGQAAVIPPTPTVAPAAPVEPTPTFTAPPSPTVTPEAPPAPQATPTPSLTPFIPTATPAPLPSPTFTPIPTPTPALVGRIALASYQNENWDIYVISADGSYGSLNRLTTEPDDDGEPAWSPDGRRIAYASLVGANPGIYVLEADGRSPRQLVYTTPSFGAGRPSWSPDGRQLVFSCRPPEAGNWEICIVDADGRNPRNITNSPAGDGSPAWSPDGWRIAFTSTVDDGFDLFVINSDGSGLTRLTKDAWARLPAWSPDGQQIAFLKNHHQLHTIRPDGSDLRQVGPYMMSAFAWSPDGQYFAFSSSSETDLIVITADGRAVTTLSTTCACRQLSWTAP